MTGPIFSRPAAPLLVVVSGPSGAGKDALLNRLKKSGYPVRFITTVTTRPQRTQERDGVDYHFVPTARFQEMMEHHELLEWARVYDNWYGIPKQPVREALDKGQDVVVKVDIQGAATIKKLVPQAILIFLTPMSLKELANRLKQRNTESVFDLALRIKTAEEEIKQLSLFDYVVFNRRSKIEMAVSQIEAILTAEKCRVTPRETVLPASLPA
ncbi:guanylate kinase [Chloroflexota bacterium]